MLRPLLLRCGRACCRRPARQRCWACSRALLGVRSSLCWKGCGSGTGPGDNVLFELLTAALTGTNTGRCALEVDLDMLGEVLNDQRGGYLDRAAGTVWPVELVEDGQVEGLDPFADADPKLWLDVPSEGSRDAYRDMADFTAKLTDPRVRGDLAAALEGKGAFRRVQAALDRHETYRVHWRVFSTERRTGRARAWLADQGYDAVP